MKMLRSFAIVGTIAVAFVIAGCSSSEGEVAPAPSGQPADDLRIVMMLNDQFDPYYLTLAEGADERADELGIDFSWQAPTTLDVASQTALLQSIASTSPDGIIMSALDADALVAPMKSIMDQGIPIVTVDADVNDDSARISTVKSAGIETGYAAADFAIELLGGEGSVGYVGYTPGVQSVDIRLEGWNERIAEASDVINSGEEYGGGNVQEYVSKTSALLSREPNLDAIFASWTNATIGAAQAVQQAGRDVAVIGVDAAPEEVALLERGLVEALIVQKPFDMGGLAVEELFDYVNDGTEPKSETLLESVVATQENMDDPEVSKYFYVESEKAE